MVISSSVAAAGLWIGLHLLLILTLGLHVTRLRMRLKAGSGHGDNPKLEMAIRAHGNLTEYVPGLLIGLTLLGLLGAQSMTLHAIGGTLFCDRILHAHGILDRSKPLPLTRALGNVLTCSLRSQSQEICSGIPLQMWKIGERR